MRTRVSLCAPNGKITRGERGCFECETHAEIKSAHGFFLLFPSAFGFLQRTTTTSRATCATITTFDRNCYRSCIYYPILVDLKWIRRRITNKTSENLGKTYFYPFFFSITSRRFYRMEFRIFDFSPVSGLTRPTTRDFLNSFKLFYQSVDSGFCKFLFFFFYI